MIPLQVTLGGAYRCIQLVSHRQLGVIKTQRLAFPLSLRSRFTTAIAHVGSPYIRNTSASPGNSLNLVRPSYIPLIFLALMKILIAQSSKENVNIKSAVPVSLRPAGPWYISLILTSVAGALCYSRRKLIVGIEDEKTSEGQKRDFVDGC